MPENLFSEEKKTFNSILFISLLVGKKCCTKVRLVRKKSCFADETASADHLFWIIPIYKGIIFIGSSLVWIIPSPSPFTYDHVYVYIYMICVYMYNLDHPGMIHSPPLKWDCIYRDWIIPGWSILHPKSQTVYIEKTYIFGSSLDDPFWIILGWSILDHPGMIHSPPQKSNCIYRMIIYIYILDPPGMIPFGSSRDDPFLIIPGWSILQPKSQTVFIER